VSEDAPQPRASLDDALAIMRDLRTRDAWDKAQTHESLRPYLNEEAHELDDALRDGDDAAMQSELGDVLLQVLFHAIIAEERGAFDVNDVAGSLVQKMTKRHPWLYGNATEREPWEQMKSKQRETLAEGLPAGLPSLHRAHRLQERAAGVGFDWPDVRGPADKVREELAEVEAEAKYAGYIARQQLEVDRLRRLEHRELPADLDYAAVPGLSNEARARLQQRRPRTLGEASRIPGVRPVDVQLILVLVARRERGGGGADGSGGDAERGPTTAARP